MLFDGKRYIKTLKTEEIEPATEIIEVLNKYSLKATDYTIYNQMFNILDETDQDLEIIIKILLLAEKYKILEENLFDLYNSIYESNLMIYRHEESIINFIHELYDTPERLVGLIDIDQILYDLELEFQS